MEEQYDESGNPIGIPTPQVRPEDAELLLNNRAQRFKSMNIPAPTRMPSQQEIKDAVASKSNPDKFRKLQEIRNGSKRGDFSKLLEKEVVSNHPTDIPINKPKKGPQGKPNPNAVHIPLQEITPSAGIKDAESANWESLLLGASNTPSRPQGNITRENMNFETPSYDDAGKEFIQNVQSKFHANMQERQKNMQAQQQNIQVQPQAYTENNLQKYQSPAAPANYVYAQPAPIAIQPGLIVISEEDLNKRITSASKKVVEQMLKPIEQMVKKLITELEEKSKGGKQVIASASTKVKQAEVVGEGIVLIDGVYYKRAVRKATAE